MNDKQIKKIKQCKSVTHVAKKKKITEYKVHREVPLNLILINELVR